MPAYEADRARRQFNPVEPENHLVAHAVKTHWGQTLRGLWEFRDAFARIQHDQSRVLTDDKRREIRRLTQNLPVLWQAAGTANEDRKEILREVIDQIIVNVESESEWIVARIHWSGRHQTETQCRRLVTRLD